MNINKRWEIHLEDEYFESFTKLLDDNDCGLGQNDCNPFAAAWATKGAWWIVCYPPEDIKLLAKLRFKVVEVVDKFGIDADFTDYPEP